MSVASKSIPNEATDTARLALGQTSESQYQHYIPRFLLKNFSFPNPRRKKTKTKPRIYPGDPLLHAVKLNGIQPEFAEMPVGRTFGNYEMYKDDSKFTQKEQGHVEKNLARIEQRTSYIIKKIIRAHDDGREEVVLSRSEKDMLRKFLFIMKYRGPIFFQRFNHQKAEDYNADDKDQFREYMQANNYTRPLDVWFDNLTAILDTNVDAETNWVTHLCNRIYPGDAQWLFANLHTMYLTLCTPSDPNEEFIITENSFGIHEGPVSYSVDRRTGESTMTSYTEYHNVAVISPKLMILLRSNLMPDPIEDKNERTRIAKIAAIISNCKFHVDPKHARSLLEGLPVAKAKSSDSMGEGCLFSGDGKDASDQFPFTFFKLSSRHTQMLNSIMLDQGCHTSLIVYNTPAALRKAIDFYLDLQPQVNGMHSMKTISDLPNDPVKLLLDKLEYIAHELGSSVKAKYHVDPLWEDSRSQGREWPKATRQGSYTARYDQPEEDDDSGCGEVIFRLLISTPPVVQEPIISSMEFLMRVIVQLELTVEAMYALDLIRKGYGEPEIPSVTHERIGEEEPGVFDFPHVVHRNIQRISQRRIHSSRDISMIPLHIWRLSWYSLCSRSFEDSGRTIASVVQEMRDQCAESDDPEIRQRFGSSHGVEYGSLQKSLQKSQSKCIEGGEASQSILAAPRENNDDKNVQVLPGLSRSEPSKAFYQIGQGLSEEQNLIQRDQRLPSEAELNPISSKQNHQDSVQPTKRDVNQSISGQEQADMPEKRSCSGDRERNQTNASSRSSSATDTNWDRGPLKVGWRIPVLIISVLMVFLLGLIQLFRLAFAFFEYFQSNLLWLIAKIHPGLHF